MFVFALVKHALNRNNQHRFTPCCKVMQSTLMMQYYVKDIFKIFSNEKIVTVLF